MDDGALKSELKQLIVRELDVRSRSPEDISDDEALFGDGLGLDSLDALQLAMSVEEHYGVHVPDGAEASQVFASVGALADYIRQHKP